MRNCQNQRYIFNKGLSIKEVRSQGRVFCPVQTFFEQGGRGWRSSTFGTKTSDFFRNIWCVRMDKKGGVETV